MLFDVTRDPPLLKDKGHTLFKEGVPVSDDRVNIGESAVHFASIQRTDAGRYSITCSNGIGEGRGSFQITVSKKFAKVSSKFSDFVASAIIFK